MSKGQRLEPIHKHAQFAPVLAVIQKLQSSGHQAVLAGGCVRDSLLGLLPKDFDVATSAPPEHVEALFASTLPVGKEFGTIVVVEQGLNIEVTTFRKDGGYSDGRRPDTVEFTDMKEDALRRDFTVNALFYDPVQEELFDFVGGRQDLEHKVLSAVGKPEQRFQEDHLRMLRAVRFVAQLGFKLANETEQAITVHAEKIADVSAERILNEMTRLLSAPHWFWGLQILQRCGLAKKVWPEVADANLGPLKNFPSFVSWENTFAGVMLVAQKAQIVETRLREWKASKDSLRRVIEQLACTALIMVPTTTRAQRLRAFGSTYYADILVLVGGLLAHQNEGHKLAQWLKDYLNVTGPEGVLPKPLLNGQDLIALGMDPGPQMGISLNRVYDAQLEGKLTTREEALAHIASQTQDKEKPERN